MTAAKKRPPAPRKTKNKAKATRRKILLVLTNRWNRNQKPVFVELEADNQGAIHEHRPLRAQPKKPLYDEVWENDEGRREWAECNKFKRKYSHPLEKRA